MNLSKRKIFRVFVRDALPARRAAFGFVAGFFALGPACALAWLLVLRFTPGALIPAASGNQGARPLSMRTATPLLVARIKAANRDGRAFVVGSSEMGGDGSTPCDSVPCLLHNTAPAKDAPLVVEYAGSAVLRAALLLDRTGRYGVFPRRLIVIVNSHYASGGNSFGGNLLPAYFADLDQWAYFRERTRQSPDLQGLPLLARNWSAGTPVHAGDGSLRSSRIILEIRIVRNTLHRVLRPFLDFSTRLDPDSGSARPSLRARMRLQMPADPPGTAFDESLIFFRRKVERFAPVASDPPRIRLVVLPVNREAYVRAGIQARRIAAWERRFESLIAERLSGSGIDIVRPELLDRPALFSDPVHYTARGRRLLADFLRAQARP